MAISLSDALDYTDAEYFEIARQYVDNLSDLTEKTYPEHYIVNVAGTLYQYNGTNWDIFRPSAYELRQDGRGYIDFTDDESSKALKINSTDNISINSGENINISCNSGTVNIDNCQVLSVDTLECAGDIILNGNTETYKILAKGNVTLNSSAFALQANNIEPTLENSTSYKAKDLVIGAATKDSLPYGANIKLKANDDLHLDVQHEKEDEVIVDRINIVAPEIRWVQKSLNSETNKYEDKNTYLFSEVFKGLDSDTLKVLQKQVTALIKNQIGSTNTPVFTDTPKFTRTWVTNPLTAYKATEYCTDISCTDKTSDFTNVVSFQIDLPINMDYAYLKSLSVTTTISYNDSTIYTTTETLDQNIVDKINNLECKGIDATGFRTHSITPTDVTISEGAIIKVIVTAEFNTGTIDVSEVAYARRAVWTKSGDADLQDASNFINWIQGGLNAEYYSMGKFNEVVCQATADKYAYFVVPTDWGTPSNVVTYLVGDGTQTSYNVEKIKDITISDGETDTSQRNYTMYRSGTVIPESIQVTLKY